MKKALHQIKKELNSLETFDSESSSEKPSVINKRNFVTRSRASKQDKRPSSPTADRTATNYSHSTITSALLVLNLASNYASHSSFRPKRRPHHSPTNINTYPLLKKE